MTHTTLTQTATHYGLSIDRAVEEILRIVQGDTQVPLRTPCRRRIRKQRIPASLYLKALKYSNRALRQLQAELHQQVTQRKG